MGRGAGRRLRLRRQHARTRSRSGACTASTSPCGRRGSAAPSSAAGARARTAGSRTPSPTPTARGCASSAAGSAFSPGASAPTTTASRNDARPYTRLVRDGVLPPGYAADDDAAFHFVGTELREVVSQREGAGGYRVDRDGERPLDARSCDARRVLASASGSGKTTLGRELARRLEVPFHELDALHHGPELDGGDGGGAAGARGAAARRRGLGRRRRVSRQARRSRARAGRSRRVARPAAARLAPAPRPADGLERSSGARSSWNGNRETLRNVLFSPDSVVIFALRNFPRRRRLYPAELAPYPHVRLRTTAAVARWLDDYSSSAISAAARGGAVGLDRPVVDLAADLLGDRRGDRLRRRRSRSPSRRPAP